MNSNVQPANQPNGATQTPSLPPAQNPGYMNADPQDIDFVLDEASGNFTIVQKSAQPEQQVVDNTQTEDVRFQGAVEQAQTQHPQEPNPYDERFAKLENALLQMGGLLQGMLQGQNLNNLQNQPQQQEEEELDLNDPRALVTLINKAVEKAISSKIQPLEAQASESRMRNEYNDAAFKYGKEFVDLTPAMVEIKKADPALSWEVIFSGMMAAKKVFLPNGKDGSIQVGNGSADSRKPQPVQNLVNQANKLAVETSGQPRAIVADRPKIQSVADAFDAAYSELFG